MQKGQIVRGFFFPADQQPSCAVGPGVRAFHNPSADACGSTRGTLRVLSFVGNVNDVSATRSGAAKGFGVVAFVGAQMLTFARSWCRAVDGKALKRFPDQLLIRHIGSGDGDAQRHTATVGQHGTLDAQLATSGRVSPGFFPSQRRLGHRPVPTLPLPVDPFQVVGLLQRQSPPFVKHAALDPLLKGGVKGAARTEHFGQRLPLAARPQHINNPGHHVSRRESRTTTLTTAFVNWKHRFHPFPERIGNRVKL